jgi:hypothetical protein
MSELPFELPDAAYAWSNLVEATLESELDEEANSVRTRRDNSDAFWEEPDDPIWSVLVASELIENSTELRSKTLSNAGHKASLERFLAALIRTFRHAITPIADPTDLEVLQRLVLLQHVAQLYTKLHGLGLHRCEGGLLQVLFASGHTTAHRLAVELLLLSPPDDWADSSLGLSHLMQSKGWQIEDVYPRLLESTAPSVLSPALDVLNHAVRVRSLPEHPAKPMLGTLLRIMGGLVQQLGKLEENPAQFGSSVKSIQKILFDSVSLCVSLCHSFALIGDPESIGKLNQASQLAHRRIRTEAAYALAKLGDKKGQERLIELASDFASRQRAIVYAEELGIEDRVDEKWTTAAALAESRLANWLAQNEQMGITPARMELLDQRTLPWPGFEQPQECFLFRYEYDMQSSVFSNVGFSGPMCSTFAHDLADISLDDTYAIFVGHDIDHPDALELPPNTIDARWIERSKRIIESIPDGVEWLETILCAQFFEHFGLLARVRAGNAERIAVLGEDEQVIYEPFTTKNQADPMLTLWLWRGRKFFDSVSI